MIFRKKRLFIWLIKAYLKKWGKRIFIFFIVGLSVFFGLLKATHSLFPKIPKGQKETIGTFGTYTVETLPSFVFSDVSRGLTKIDKDGTVKPDIASSWKISDSGKKYTFSLKKNIFFSDGTPLTSSYISYSFSNVTTNKKDPYTIEFLLKDNYSPFLITVSRPLLKNGFIGVGEFRVKDIRLNGNFVESLVLSSVKNVYHTKSYLFYPTEESLKLAFVQGEISTIKGVSDVSFKNMSFTQFPHVEVKKITDHTKLVAIFYNTKDSSLSSEKARGALTYALPDDFKYGQRSYTPFPPSSWAFSETFNQRRQDVERAQSLLKASQIVSESGEIKFFLKTLPKYKLLAQEIKKSWKRISVDVDIEIVETVPSTFQIFLGDFKIPKDPDQYTLWHKDQNNNITNYSNLRIDKLLEDGRKTTDLTQRKKIYSDFQKYLLADSPASFLYFPFEYEVVRK